MIKDLKDLQALLKLCRKQGITEIKLGATEIKFGELPKRKEGEAEEADIATDELTPEQLAFYSSGGAQHENM